MKRFMYVGIGLLALSLSAMIGSNIGASRARAETSHVIAGTFAVGYWHYVVTASGDVYRRDNRKGPAYSPESPAELIGNFWSNTTSSPGDGK